MAPWRLLQTQQQVTERNGEKERPRASASNSQLLQVSCTDHPTVFAVSIYLLTCCCYLSPSRISLFSLSLSLSLSFASFSPLLSLSPSLELRPVYHYSPIGFFSSPTRCCCCCYIIHGQQRGAAAAAATELIHSCNSGSSPLVLLSLFRLLNVLLPRSRSPSSHLPNKHITSNNSHKNH